MRTARLLAAQFTSVVLIVGGFVAPPAYAVVDISVNLRYTHPVCTEKGGTWEIVAKTDDPDGLAEIVAVIGNVDSVGIYLNDSLGALPIDPVLASVDDPSAGIYGRPGVVVTYQQDPNAPVFGVGTGSGLTDVLCDPAWDGADCLVMGGTFGAERPFFGIVAGAGTSTHAAELDAAGPPHTFIPATLGQVVVRGDSVGMDGLPYGDITRDWMVDLFNDVLGIFNGQCVGCDPGWDGGDLNCDGNVTLFEDVLPAYNNQGVYGPVEFDGGGCGASCGGENEVVGLLDETPGAIPSQGTVGILPSAEIVPEPAAGVLLTACLAGLLVNSGFRRGRSQRR